MQYSDTVLDHFEAPRNVTGARPATAIVGRGGSIAAGAVIEFCLSLEGGVVERATFRAWGCPNTVAVASWLTGQLRGQPLEQACRLDLSAVAAELDLPPEKWYCVLAAEDALQAAAEEYRRDFTD